MHSNQESTPVKKINNAEKLISDMGVVEAIIKVLKSDYCDICAYKYNEIAVSLDSQIHHNNCKHCCEDGIREYLEARIDVH